MSGSFTPHLEVLPERQRRVWSMLRPLAGLGFVLYGGTAVALRLGNRQSVDFDFFSDRPLDKGAVRAALEPMGQWALTQDEVNTLSISLQSDIVARGSVSLSFFGSIKFGRVGEPDMTDDGVVQVASLLDLMATKVAVITQRAEAKDYRDLAAMLRDGASLPSALGAAVAIYALSAASSRDPVSWTPDGIGPRRRAALGVPRWSEPPLQKRCMGKSAPTHLSSD